MTDLASLVLGAPSYVEGFIKIGRAVMKYKSLAKDHIETIEDALFCASTLEYYTSFIDAKDQNTLNHPSRPLLEEALGHAFDALDVALLILRDLSRRLSTDSKPHGRLILAKLANAVADRMIRSRKDAFPPLPSRGRISNTKIISEMSYLAFGSVEIKEAMARVNKWTMRFNQLLLTSPNLRVRRDNLDIGDKHKKMADDVAFVACARERLAVEHNVPVIGVEHLDSVYDIDPDHKSEIYRIEDGDYAGYIVDVRDLNLRRSRAVFEAERSDTLKICRLFAELPIDSEIGARASVGILPCAGYAVADAGKKHYLLFRLPSDTGMPCTLRSLLLSGPPSHSINSRLEFCVKLATSVLIVHSLGLVHKNIRPESILIANSLSTGFHTDELGTPFLISFGQARLSSGPSDCTSYAGAALARTLYVHPRHISSTKRKKFQMRDDIYSLGICFLEIAIWRSLFVWDADKGGFVCDFSLVQISDDHYEEVLRNRGRSIHQDKCWIRRYDIIQFARKYIPATMGDTFRDIVLDCLEFGDTDPLSYDATLEKTFEVDSGENRADLESVMFVQKILTKLRTLVFSF